MKNGRLSAAAVVAMALVACATPRDDLSMARDSLGRGDLLATIAYLDRVPPADLDYAQARSLARAVERRMRTGQRLFSRGLTLRAEWRDEDAIEAFELARQVWPCIDGVDLMIEATHRRIDTLQPGGVVDVAQLPESAVATTAPIDVESPTDAAETGVAELMVADAWNEYLLVNELQPSEVDPGVAEGADEVAPKLEPSPGVGVTADQLRRVQLATAAANLADGRLDAALDGLESMYFREPQVKEVRALLLRVLHQRALLFYGKGQLQAAIDSWGRVLQIEPQHAQALEFYQAAETELRSLRAAAPM